MSTRLNIPLEDLPVWMRQAQRGFDWGLVLVIALSIFAAWPFIFQSDLPRTNAAENYAFRAADYADTLREGRLYPRWSPHVSKGYGAPVPNYYPPGAPYTAAAIEVLFTNDTVIAIRLVFILSVCLAGGMTYLLVTRWSGAAAGVLASTLYIYSPYVGSVAPLVLGDLPGVMAHALIPLLLWAVSRMLTINRPMDVLLSSLAVAALVVTEPRAAVVGLALTAGLVIWYMLRVNRKAPWLLALAAGVLGIALAAFYWLPALLEQDFVSWIAPGIKPQSASLTIQGLVSIFQQSDSGRLLPPVQVSLGFACLVFTVLALLGILIGKKRAEVQAVFLLMGIVILTVGITLLPTNIWLLGPAMLCLSIGGSAALHFRDRFPPESRRVVLAAMLLLVLAGSLAVWIAPLWPDDSGSFTPEDQVSYELQGFGTAVLPPGASLPTTIDPNLPANRFLLTGYQNNDINKLSADQLSLNRQASLLAHTSHGDSYQIQTLTATTFDILTAYFPGWMAAVNGRPVPVSANPDTGLIEVSVPKTAKPGELDITLGPTETRSAAWVMSWVALAILGIITWVRRRDAHLYDDLTLLSVGEARLLSILVGTFALVIVLFIVPGAPFPLRAPPGHALSGSIALSSRSNGGIEALAFRLDKAEYRPGDTIEFSVYWRALRFIPVNYQARAYLTASEQGIRWFQTELHTPGGYPTRRWVRDLYVEDTYSIAISRTVPPGVYQIAVEILTCNPSCSSGNPLTFYAPDGTSQGQALVLPVTIHISS